MAALQLKPLQLFNAPNVLVWYLLIAPVAWWCKRRRFFPLRIWRDTFHRNLRSDSKLASGYFGVGIAFDCPTICSALHHNLIAVYCRHRSANLDRLRKRSTGQKTSRDHYAHQVFRFHTTYSTSGNTRIASFLLPMSLCNWAFGVRALERSAFSPIPLAAPAWS
jgi:hypothetical protein